MIDGIIYKLYSKNALEFYVGSSTNFHKRKSSHKSCCNNQNSKLYNDKKYHYIRDNGGYDKFDYEILELGEYEDEKCMRDRERYFVETLKPSLNSYIPNRTKKEYDKQYHKDNKEKIKEFRENNKEKILKQKATYRKNNKEKITERNKNYREINEEKIKAKWYIKIECEFCKSETTKNHLKRHQATKKCLLAQSQRTDITLTTT